MATTTHLSVGSQGASGQNLGDDVVHEVSTLEWLLADVARLRVPRALCGVVLVADPDRPDPAQLGASKCPRCAAKGSTP